MQNGLRFPVLAAVFVVAAGTAGRTQAPEPHPAGIYMASGSGADGASLVRLRGARADIKTKGLGMMMLTQGLAKGSFEADLPGPVADIRTSNGAATFYFYFDTKAAEDPTSVDPMAALGMVTGDAMPMQAHSAGDFVLVQLKASGDRRSVNVGKMGSSGIPKNAVPVDIERLAEGAYRLRPKEPLKPGEYAFSFVSGTGPSGVLWDFGVDAAGSK
jgi:hypothetical protein